MSELPLLERAERLRDAVLESKLWHPDPWSYTPKARTWSRRAQQIAEDIVTGGDSDARRQAFAILEAEVEEDPDFKEALRHF
jgi:hypothetical protein